MKTSKGIVVLSSFTFFLLLGLLITDSSYKRMDLFWTDLFGVFLMPVTVAITGTSFVYALLVWYEQTRLDCSSKDDQEN